MAQYYVQVAIEITNAVHLPKTDTLSSIDPFIIVKSGGVVVHKTKHKDNDPNPHWGDLCTVKALYGGTTTVEFELWDQNTFKDKKVGVATLQLTQSNIATLQTAIPLSFTMESSKHANDNSKLFVQVVDYAYTAESLHKLLQHIPGVLYDPHGLGRLYVPIPNLGPAVYVGLEYEKKCLDVKLFITEPHASNAVYLDMVISNDPRTQIRRRAAKKPWHVFGNLHAVEELKLNDVPFRLISEIGKVMIFMFQKTLDSSTDLDKVVTRHGWSGSMGWEAASSRLRDVELDRKEEEIFMRQDDTFIVVDFDQGNVDMKCFVLDSPSNSDLAYDFTLDGADCKKTTEIFHPPRTVLGKYKVQRKLELDDVPFGTYFSNMKWYKYKVTNPIKVNLSDVVQVRPF